MPLADWEQDMTAERENKLSSEITCVPLCLPLPHASSIQRAQHLHTKHNSCLLQLWEGESLWSNSGSVCAGPAAPLLIFSLCWCRESTSGGLGNSHVVNVT